MKKPLLYSAIFAVLVATPALSADVSLVGTWTGQRDRIAKDEGRRGGLATLVISEQQGNTFTGRLKRSNSTGDVEEPLWGAFTPGANTDVGYAHQDLMGLLRRSRTELRAKRSTRSRSIAVSPA